MDSRERFCSLRQFLHQLGKLQCTPHSCLSPVLNSLDLIVMKSINLSGQTQKELCSWKNTSLRTVEILSLGAQISWFFKFWIAELSCSNKVTHLLLKETSWTLYWSIKTTKIQKRHIHCWNTPLFFQLLSCCDHLSSSFFIITAILTEKFSVITMPTKVSLHISICQGKT